MRPRYIHDDVARKVRRYMATLQRFAKTFPTFATFTTASIAIRECSYCLTSTFVISSDIVVMPLDDASKYMSFRKRRSLRLPCYDYSESRPYHVTWGTHDRKRILWREGLARVVIECMEAEAVRVPVNLLAYCVMPDHVHVLLMPRDGANVIRFIQSVKSRTTRAYGSVGGEGKLWQRGFYDHIVRREESVSRIAEYIIANPVRAGLAESVPAYPFSRSFLPPL